MKKIFLNLFVICILMMTSIVVYADMGAPEIKPYNATPRSIEGATYYKPIYDENNLRYEEVGKIKYGDVVRIFYENDNNGIKYGEFQFDDDEYYSYYHVKLSDMYIVTDRSENIKHGAIDYPLLSLSDNLEIHKGPSYIYDVVGKIPKLEQFVGYRQIETNEDGSTYELEMLPWFYVEYGDVSGWVCELKSSIGSYNNGKIIIKRDLTLEDGTIVIPASTIINGYYETDMWSSNVFVFYNDNFYFVDSDNIGVEANDGEWYRNLGKITYDGAKLYRMESINSDVILDNIPNGAELNVKYIEWDMRWIGWAYAEYNGVEGWFVIFDTDEARDQFLSGQENVYGKETSNIKVFDGSIEEQQSEENNYEQQNGSKNETTEKQKILPEKISQKADEIAIPSIVLYIAIAIIIALTVTVIILLINRKSK